MRWSLAQQLLCKRFLKDRLRRRICGKESALHALKGLVGSGGRRQSGDRRPIRLTFEAWVCRKTDLRIRLLHIWQALNFHADCLVQDPILYSWRSVSFV